LFSVPIARWRSVRLEDAALRNISRATSSSRISCEPTLAAIAPFVPVREDGAAAGGGLRRVSTTAGWARIDGGGTWEMLDDAQPESSRIAMIDTGTVI
jgi:hypothetical protein